MGTGIGMKKGSGKTIVGGGNIIGGLGSDLVVDGLGPNVNGGGGKLGGLVRSVNNEMIVRVTFNIENHKITTDCHLNIF